MINFTKPEVPPNVTTDSTLASSVGLNAFTPGRTPFDMLLNFDSIKDNLRNIIFFRKGDYLDNPDFGIGIQDYVFEQGDQDLKIILSQEIRRQINKYEPRAVIRSLNVYVPDWATDSLVISLDLLINNVPFSLSAGGSGGFNLSQQSVS
jgi:phage baseplate assembly protein W